MRYFYQFQFNSTLPQIKDFQAVNLALANCLINLIDMTDSPLGHLLTTPSATPHHLQNSKWLQMGPKWPIGSAKGVPLQNKTFDLSSHFKRKVDSRERGGDEQGGNE